MRKTTIATLLICSSLTLGLTACGGTEQLEVTEEQNNIVETGQFVGLYGKNHVEFKLNGDKMMYTFKEELRPTLKLLQPGDLFYYEFESNGEGIYTITSLTPKEMPIAKKTKSKEVKVEEKPKEEEKEEEVKKDIVIQEKNNSITEEAVLWETREPYNVYTLPEYDFKGNSITFKENPTYNVSIELLSNDSEIKKLRWRASDDLKILGKLKELKGNNIYDPQFRNSEFVFHSNDGSTSKNIVVTRMNGQLVRFTMTYPTQEDSNQVESRLWAMMENIETK